MNELYEQIDSLKKKISDLRMEISELKEQNVIDKEESTKKIDDIFKDMLNIHPNERELWRRTDGTR